ncbi:hypothetical protein C8R43DRAFT_1242576 [Mycena crocata]|nr:hypothetical protein C8R43DRAFT_1242576 [Mycena crocata]
MSYYPGNSQPPPPNPAYPGGYPAPQGAPYLPPPLIRHLVATHAMHLTIFPRTDIPLHQ